MRTFPLLLLLFLLLCVRLEGCGTDINMHIHCRAAISRHCFRQAVKKKGGGRSVEGENGSGEQTMGCAATQKDPFTTTWLPPLNERKEKLKIVH